MDCTSFEVAVPDSVLDDLRERLPRTRWPSEVADSGWTYGTNLAYLQELVAYWANDYDWRAAEARLNPWPQFRAWSDCGGSVETRFSRDQLLTNIVNHDLLGEHVHQLLDALVLREPTQPMAAALEEPRLLADDVRAFFQPLRGGSGE